MEKYILKFVDYKCKDCEEISEVFIRGNDDTEIKCEKCGNNRMVKVFTPISFKSNSSEGSSSTSSCSSCSGGSCSTCSR